MENVSNAEEDGLIAWAGGTEAADWPAAEAGTPAYGSGNAVASFELAPAVFAYVGALETNRRYVVARQLARCGTPVGANVREAQHAESRADFIHKGKIAAREAAETDYRLQLCTHAPDYPTPPPSLTDALLSVRRLLAHIIVSSKANAPK